MLKERSDTEPTEMETLIFEQLVPPDHYLRRVKPCVDVERCRALVTDRYSPAMGRTAEDPVRMIKRALLPCHDHRSAREVMAAAQVNVAFRFFLDRSLERHLPVPSVRGQLRTRLGVERPQALVDQRVTPAREPGLVRDRLRRKDATQVLANIAVPSTLRWVAQTRPRRLAAACPSAPARVAAEAAEVERVRQVTADRTDVDRLAHRVAHLRAMVAGADGLQQDLGPLPASPDQERTRFEAALAWAHRVLADRDDPDQGDQGRRVVAPEARCGTPGAYVAGDRLDMSLDADSARLTALNLLPGNGDEARDAPTRLAAAQGAPGHAVAAVSIDGMGWHGEVLRTLSVPEGLGVEVYVPPPAPEETPWFRPEACSLEAQRGVVRCPGGPQTATKARRANHTGGKWVLARHPCACCLLHAPCLATLPQKKGRSVIKHDDQVEDDAARARATTPGYAAVRQQHPRVERQLADRVRYHDGRRGRYRGQWRVNVQSRLTGLVVHVQRMVTRLRPQGAPPLVQPVSSLVWRGKHGGGDHARRSTQTAWHSCPSTGRSARFG